MAAHAGLRRSGLVVDPVRGRIAPATVTVREGCIAAVEPDPGAAGSGRWIVPGLVDAHVHLESSMIRPAEFGRLALAHGTVATLSDPHEIANVEGVAGVERKLASAPRHGTPTRSSRSSPSSPGRWSSVRASTPRRRPGPVPPRAPSPGGACRRTSCASPPARALGTPLPDPFMAMSFLSLLVLPELRLGDRGLFDAGRFRFVPVAG